MKQFKKTHPHPTFGESTARKLIDRYYDITKQNRAVDKKMPCLKRGKPLLLGKVLEEKVKHFFTKIEEKRQPVVNTAVAVATAEALIARSKDEHPKLIDL